MAVPSSGELSLFKIAKEVHLDDYNNTVPAPGSGGCLLYTSDAADD